MDIPGVGNDDIDFVDAGCYEYIPSGPPDTTAPSIPQNLTAQAVSESQIDLSWDASSDPESGVSHYNIYYSDGTLIGSTVDFVVSLGQPTVPDVVGMVQAAAESAITAAGLTVGSVTNAYSDTVAADNVISSNPAGGTTVAIGSAVELVISMGQPVVPGSGLVGYWRMNDYAANRTVVDSSGNGNNGTAQQNTSVLHTAGQIGGALTFNGTSDYVNCGDDPSLDITDAITLSVWVNFDRLGIDQGIVDKGFNNTDGVIRLWIWRGNNNVYFDAPEGTIRINGTPASGFSTDTWYNIVATYDKNVGSNNLNLYINATNVATSTDTDAMGTNGANLIIGARKQGSGEFFHGLIDNVMIFNRALSQVEIDALYNGGAGTETF